MNNSTLLSNILSIDDDKLYKCIIELTELSITGMSNTAIINTISHQIVNEIGIEYHYAKSIVSKSVLEQAALKWADRYSKEKK